VSTDMEDRLTFGEGPLGWSPDAQDPDADVDAPPRRSSRAFVYVAVAMAGLVVLGLLALVAALTVWLPAQRGQQMAAVTSTVAALTRQALVWTATPAPTVTPQPPTATPTLQATNTPVPTATSTRVVGRDPSPSQQATRTPTPVQFPGTTPAAGLGIGGMAATAVGMTGLLLVARKLRG
jgi:type II secretory pathway pseudopilin PulG